MIGIGDGVGAGLRAGPDMGVQINLEVLDSIDSTNNYLLKQYAQANFSENTKKIKIVLAEQQTQGRGRLNREWISPPGENIYFSCQINIKKKMCELSGLSLIVSLALIQTLEKFVGEHKLKIKWPNDILYHGAKLSGTLIEIAGERDGACTVIIGIGINVNMILEPEPNNPISQSWTSIRKIIGEEIDRNQIVSELIKNLIPIILKFEQQGFDCFLEQWHSYDGLIGQRVHLQMGAHQIEGKAVGINAQGHLLLELANGNIQAFSSGDVIKVKI